MSSVFSGCWFGIQVCLFTGLGCSGFQLRSPVQDGLGRAEVEVGGVELDDSRETMQNKIRDATRRKVPYILILGDNEVQAQTVSVRLRGARELRGMPLGNLVERVLSEDVKRQDVTD